MQDQQTTRDEALAEVDVIKVLLGHARLLRRAKDVRRALAAGRWELRLQAELARVEADQMEESRV